MSLPPDDARVLAALYRWRYGPDRPRFVPHYLLLAEFHGTGIDVLATLDRLATRGLVSRTGRGDGVNAIRS
jgi:hypothetical protein